MHWVGGIAKHSNMLEEGGGRLLKQEDSHKWCQKKAKMRREGSRVGKNIIGGQGRCKKGGVKFIRA